MKHKFLSKPGVIGRIAVKQLLCAGVLLIATGIFENFFLSMLWFLSQFPIGWGTAYFWMPNIFMAEYDPMLCDWKNLLFWSSLGSVLNAYFWGWWLTYFNHKILLYRRRSSTSE